MRTLTVTELVRNFGDYISRVAYRRERYLLTRGGKRVAMLHPVPAGGVLADLPELLGDLPKISADEAEAFSLDIERARGELDRLEPGDPWPS